MKPLGRRPNKGGCKWKVKKNGKHLTGWWEDNIPPKKCVDKRPALKEIHLEIDTMEEESDFSEDQSYFNNNNWECNHAFFQDISCQSGSCMSCDFKRQRDKATGWDDPNFIEAWDYEDFWLAKSWYSSIST